MAERDDDALWRGPRQEAAQQSGERVEAGAGRWASCAGALGWGGGILARTQQLRVIDHERALVGRADRLWALDPVALFFGSVGINAQAPHPKAALLGANFLLSREAQQFLTKRGRMPTRTDVAVNPPEVTDRLKDRKIIATIFSGEEQKKWQGLFREIFTPK